MGGVAREMNLLQEASNLCQSGNPLVTDNRPGPGSTDADTDGRRTGEIRPSVSPVAGWDNEYRQLYLRLLRLLNVTVTTIVLSRTSAGGINAALLGLFSAAGVDMGGLRDLLLTTGSLDMLLRDPGEPNPLSLRQGDKVLFSQLDRGIRVLPKRVQVPAPVGRSGNCCQDFAVWRIPIASPGFDTPAGFPPASDWQLQTAFRKKAVLGDRWGHDQAS
jgi:hypothetical protein